MNYIQSHLTILGICLSLLILSPDINAVFGATEEAALINIVKITEVNTSWFPMVRVTIHSGKELTDEDTLSIFENGREIKIFKRIPSDKDKNVMFVKWLSRASTDGPQNLKIKLGSNEAAHTFLSFKHRQYGNNIQQTVKIKTMGLNGKSFPCKIVALHENGDIFEDISTKGGYGRLGSGFAIPSGNIMIELRLLSPDVAIDHFKAFIKPSQPTRINRTFGFFKLPFSERSKIEQLKIQIEIEGKTFRYPSIHSNLFALYTKLAPAFSEGVIPLPEGDYIVGLLPATSDSKQEREKYSVKITNGATIELENKNIIANGENSSNETDSDVQMEDELAMTVDELLPEADAFSKPMNNLFTTP